MSKFLESSIKNLPIVCPAETVPRTALKTLNLEFSKSTFRTLTFSVPIPRTSFTLVLRILPVTPKCVTKPVIPSVPIATAVVPTPARRSTLEEIPTL